MIKDCVSNIGIYAELSERLSAALEYIRSVGADGFSEETVEIADKDVFAMHQLYTTKSEAGRLYENHKEYIDVQYVLEGTEVIRVTDVSGLNVAKAYDTDAALYDYDDGTDVKLGSGDFVILYPHDAHVPQLQLGAPADVKKIVVKVRV